MENEFTLHTLPFLPSNWYHSSASTNLVSPPGLCNQLAQTGRLKHRNVLSPSFGGWKSAIKLPAERVPSEDVRESLLHASPLVSGICWPSLALLCFGSITPSLPLHLPVAFSLRVCVCVQIPFL